MQSVGYIATQSQSPTQSLQAMSRLLEQEGMSRGAKAAGVLKGLANLPSRFIAKGFDDFGENIIRKQKEAYEDELIEALINPERAVELRKYFDSLNPKIYYYTQTLARGGFEALNEIFNQNQARLNEIIDIEKEDPSFGPLQTEQPLEDLQGSINQFQMPNINQPLFEEPGPDLTIEQKLSPAILPDELDREIAMRGRGIAGLG